MLWVEEECQREYIVFYSHGEIKIYVDYKDGLMAQYSAVQVQVHTFDE